MEGRLIPKMGIKYYGISAGKFRRYHKSKILNIIDPTTIISNIKDFFNFIEGIFEAKKIISHEKPDVIFAKGGYVSLPVGIAAKLLKIPLVIHESDIVMGLANRKMAKFAEKVCVTFPINNYKEIDPEKIIETGNPIREDILGGRKERYLSEIGFSNNKKTILILGGSQGSLFVNELIMEKLEEILRDFQLIWVAGDRDYQIIDFRVSELDEELKKNIKVYGFITTEIADIYASTDLYIGRAGSNVIFELASYNIPSIFIPLGSSAGSHQFENARVLSRSGAAYIFKEETITSKKLLHQVKYLFENQNELNDMASKMNKWANLHSSDDVANVILKTGEDTIEQIRQNIK